MAESIFYQRTIMIEELLIKKGFNSDLASIYSRLLNDQTISLNSIDERLLKLLIDLSLVAEINNRILLIDPKITFSTWRNEVKWTNENRNIKIKNTYKLLPKNISLVDIEEIENAIISNFNFSQLTENILIGQNINQITALICNSILFIKQELRAIAIDTELTNTSSIWGTIEPKLKAGMKYTRICDINEILLHGIEIKKKDISIGVSLYILKKNDIKEKIYIFDKKAIFIFEALDNDFYNQSGQLINSEYISSIYIDKFNEYLKQSIAANYVIKILSQNYLENIEKIKNEYLKEIYSSICSYGIFSEHQKVSLNETKELIENGFISQIKYKDDISILLPKINIEELWSNF